jgi:CCR4-NOT transcriptional regulation complex NOT5 subunit
MVRIGINKTFRKGTEPRYSDDNFTVESVLGQRITFSLNNKILLESELLKVDGDTTSKTTNPVDIVNKENRITVSNTTPGKPETMVSLINSNSQRHTIVLTYGQLICVSIDLRI